MKLIVEQEQDYLITVKGNQPKLLASLTAAFAQTPPLTVARQHQVDHGRAVERIISVLPPPADLDPQWVGVQRIIQVERRGHRGQQPFQETMFYISSLQRDAQAFAQLIQAHWQVENRLHWTKDVVLREDDTPTCAGQAITGFAILRTIVVNLFRAHGYQSITEALDLFAHDLNKLFSLLN